ncbi:MAG: ABC transporter ATP-binding protein [Alphaproteobacteria bacterium]
MSDMPKIAFKDVQLAFGPKQVLKGIDLEVAEGESLVVIGGSGSGKSVLIKTLLGITTPDQGQVLVDGENVVGISGQKREALNSKIGMLFQGGALFDSLKVWENAAFGLIQTGVAKGDAARGLAIDTLARVGLDKTVADLMPVELSGGMQKRVALARAIADQPEIIFFDEPTTGLDPIMSDVINHLITECVRDLGATAITITHDMRSARTIADKVAMLYDGKIVWDAPVADLDNPQNDFVDQFVHGRADGPIQMTVRH